MEAPILSSLPASLHPGALAREGAGRVMLQFQRLMDRFLETQRNVMLTYLQGTPAVAPPPRASPPAAPLAERLASLPAPGAPPAPPQPPATVPSPPAAEGDQPLPAQKNHAGVSLEPAGEGLVAADGYLDREALTAYLLSIVSERTGYPTDMLDLGLDLEANLGIDSIKRVEILGRLRQSLTDAGWEQQDLDMERLAGLKTLRGIIDCIVEGDEQASPPPGVTDDHQPSAISHQSSAIIQRFTLRAVDRPLSTPPGGLAPGRVVLITDDESGVAQEVGARLQQEGYLGVMLRVLGGSVEPGPGVYEADLRSPEDIERVLGLIRQTRGPVAGLVHLLPLRPHAPFETMDLSAWRERLALETRSLFLLAKALRPDLEAAAQAGGAALMTASGMGGGARQRSCSRHEPVFPWPGCHRRAAQDAGQGVASGPGEGCGPGLAGGGCHAGRAPPRRVHG